MFSGPQQHAFTSCSVKFSCSLQKPATSLAVCTVVFHAHYVQGIVHSM